MHAKSILQLVIMFVTQTTGITISQSPDYYAFLPSFKYPPNFRNVVFSTKGQVQTGSPQPRWSTLSSHGVANWIGSLNSSLPQVPENETPLIVKENVPRIMINLSLVGDAVQLLDSDNPSTRLKMLNEPDFIWPGSSKSSTPPIKAAKYLQPLLEKDRSNAKLISPALAKSSDFYG
ncbi:hypothetical protein K431DRAFT_343330 [Polychaeton citri CBS 116435]|uniref:Uncharacterized protein n=1 Tax=Polychaeton citri CBS 116435 TaxID=1314669 RepID=A0A9P4QGJ3_9PEZI|nr:hypothetical protein K431DRAFT_343330 [Polychaeton citri CBS 116435]